MDRHEGPETALATGLASSARDRLVAVVWVLVPVTLAGWSYLSYFTARASWLAASVLTPALLVAAIVVGLLLRRGRLHGVALDVSIAVLALLQSGIIVAQQWTARIPVFNFAFFLYLLALSQVVLDLRWMVGISLVSVAMWVPVGAVSAGGEDGILFYLAAISVALAWYWLFHQRRTLTALLRLTAVERAGRERLERELIDRRAAEADRDVLRDQLFHAQKLEAIGTLAGGVAHDMNNVLCSILVTAEAMREDAATPAVAADADEIVGAAQRGAELPRNLLGFSRRGQYRAEVFEVGAVAGEVARLLRRTLGKGIELRSDAAPGLFVDGDPAQLGQLVVNLALNAADAMSGEGTLTVTVGAASLDAEAATRLGTAAGEFVLLEVRDTGCGMDEPTRARIFEPFFTTKPQGKGTGLGLAMVWSTVERHHGAIEVTSAPGAGTTFKIYLPRRDAAAVAIAPRPPPRVAGRGGTILVVDDEPGVREAGRRILERAGFSVLTADGGAAALELAGQRTVDAVVLDMAMPVMSGAECFRRLHAAQPELPIVLVSGYAAEAEVRALLAGGAAGFLDKPFRAGELERAISFALGTAAA